MNFIEVEAPQRSPEWFLARAGRLTGSRAADMLTKIKSGEAAARRDYRMQLAVERLTGQPQESSYINADMQRGIDMEDTAVAAYEAQTGNVVRRTGFLMHKDHMAGCSLDGDVDGFEGILECKVPKSATHVGYFKSGGLPPNHLAQCTHNLWISGAKWIDFASWDSRLPESLRLFHVRVYAKDVDLAAYEAEALKFLAEVDAEVKSLLRLGESVRQSIAA
jgi:predicted phage-related endonuclease